MRRWARSPACWAWVTGESGKLGARDYYRNTLFPAIESERMATTTEATSRRLSLRSTAPPRMACGTCSCTTARTAANWVNANYLNKERLLAVNQIENQAKGGQIYTQMQAAQFHGGGRINGFGSLATSSTEGFIHAMMDETVMNPSASSTHGSVLNAMNGGASASDVAGMYLAASSRGGGGGSSSVKSGDTHNWSVSAMDAKSFSSFLKNGGAQQIVKHTNGFASQYAGDGISG